MDNATENDEAIPTRISAENVAERYESLSEGYDEKCGELSYPGPTLISDLMQEYLSDRDAQLAILDLGCGTGLLGSILRAKAQSLVGVDLSEKMLRRAEATSMYDRLVHADAIEYLRDHPKCYDFIVAAGTFQSFGDLSELLRVSLDSLKPQGYLAFTLACGPLMGDDFYHQPEQYFTHAPQYVMRQLGELGICGGTIRRVSWPAPDPHSEHALVIVVQPPVDDLSMKIEVE